VAEILEGLLAKRGKQPLGRYDLIEHALAVIAAALDSGDPGTIQTGQRIMDALGRSGHIRIAELVQTAKITAKPDWHTEHALSLHTLASIAAVCRSSCV
jgi:hypothetical protein